MKNSYKGYWFSCETIFRKDIKHLLEPRKWILLLESKTNNKTHSIGLDNRMTMGEVLDLAYLEIDKQILQDSKQA
jgi:hypothetical protein|tara:strand:- start:88 stop:312 length:225 start_codon:yes stop_codon:yes gene_type:complete